jgi:tetratricopeptide (TPR) repeat protein
LWQASVEHKMSTKKVSVLLLIMVAVCLITYANHFYNDFHFDDAHVVQNNLNIHSLKNIPLFFTDGSTSSTLPQNQSYRPIVTTSLAFDYWLGDGYNLFYFHLSMFVVFVMQGVLMVFFFRRIFNTATSNSLLVVYTALIAATWYLLHPAIAETVNYVSARSDLLSTSFILLAFILYSYSPFCRRWHLYNIAIIVGALAKPLAIMFAPLLFFYILFFEERLSLPGIFKKQHLKQTWQAIKKSLPAFICCIGLYYLQAKLTPKTWEPGGTSTIQYLITQPFVMAHYYAMLFVPNGLSADTDWGLLPGVADWRFTVGCLFILIMLTIAFVTSRKPLLRPISFGILWFFITLIPTSSIIPLAEVMNDHRMYLPFVGLCASVVWALTLVVNYYKQQLRTALPAYRTVLSVMLILTLSAYAYGTHRRNEVWSTEESLWHDVTIQSPKNGRGLMNYGLAKMAKGDYVTADIYFQKALVLLPQYFALNVNIGILKAATGNTLEAEVYFKRAIEFGPAFPDSYVFYGRYLKEQRRYNEAVDMLTKAMSLSPANLYARSLLMETYELKQDWPNVKKLAESTLEVNPGNAEAMRYLKAAEPKRSIANAIADDLNQSPTAKKYLDLSLKYYNAGDYPKCIEACKNALKLEPNLAEAYNNIGAAYNRMGNYAEAVAALQVAIKLKPDFQLAKNNLAFAQSKLVR